MLTPLQHRIADLFFAMDESAGFALAGGAALIVRGAIERETQDLDFFADHRRVRDITDVVTALTVACEAAGLALVTVQLSRTFGRFEINDPEASESMLIDVALDAIDEHPTATAAGPTLTTTELATNKVLALYGRMEARDFEDTWKLAQQFAIEDILRSAAEKDAGFDTAMFADSIGWIERLPDRRFTLPVDEIVKMRTWFARLQDALIRNDPLPDATDTPAE